MSSTSVFLNSSELKSTIAHIRKRNEKSYSAKHVETGLEMNSYFITEQQAKMTKKINHRKLQFELHLTVLTVSFQNS